ncbi:transglycosylase SLT domain-containing protein [Nitriliruptor alkaliphilus]|uniref:transglycosylase SLT domain-containing protein n=1 Tax=Nitriliruptor alkaliphilus TaxID=427918 RepID=UPI000698B7DD|nr:transglycosylase SLT domain-containing protein [Nitriliruptor alkaliphilus]
MARRRPAMTDHTPTIGRRGLLLGAAGALLAGCLPDLEDGPLASWCNPDPSADADEIPAPALDAYHAAAAAFGLPWSLLAGIGWIESRHTPTAIGPPLDGGPNVRAIPATPYGTSLHGDPRWERAVGMMQFLPSTFRTYRDRGLVEDPRDPADAATAAAAYLLDSGAPDDIRGALLTYNRSTTYVDAVLDAAARYAADGATPVDCQATPVASIEGAAPEAVLALADEGRIVLTERERRDLVHPRMDPRVIAIMLAIAERHAYAVSVIRTGHSRCVGGGSVCASSRVSNHWEYRAVDIYSLDGKRIDRGHGDARHVVGWLHDLNGELRPGEVGSPFPDWTATTGWFTDAAHQGHIHIGYAH